VPVDTVCVGPSAESNQSAIVTPSVRYGSLADMLGCSKKRPLYLSKQTLLGVGIEVRYVPLADIGSPARLKI
jgi:hypothetical protein